MRTATDRGLGFSLSTRTEGTRVIATLCGELDIASAPALRDQLLDLLRPATSRLVLDLSAVSYADASGLAVLVGTARRAGLLGGFLRLAAPALAVTRVLALTGLHRQLDVFPTIQAAITSPPSGTRRLDSRGYTSRRIAAGPAHTGPASGHTGRAWRSADAGELRLAIAAVLMHVGAWHDADPRRQFTPCLQALARAYASASHTALTQAAQSLLLMLAQRPLTPSPAVAATASRLRHLLDPDPRSARQQAPPTEYPQFRP